MIGPKFDAMIENVRQMTERNDHTGSQIAIAEYFGHDHALHGLRYIATRHEQLGHMPPDLDAFRRAIASDMLRNKTERVQSAIRSVT